MEERRAGPQSIGQVIFKVASRCNLNCVYCYVYNKADSSWKQRPTLMSAAVYQTALQRIQEYCRTTGRTSIDIAFHGGEPTLIGVETFRRWCDQALAVLAENVRVRFTIQTNGTLLDREWARAFQEYGVDVGVSLDGAKESHDLFRVDHTGAGSYDRVRRGLAALGEENVPFGILCVVPLGADPILTHRSFLETGCSTITYLLPHYTYDDIAPVRDRYGATPCADFLVPVFDDWWFNGYMDIRVRDLWNIARVILGGASTIETIGNTPPLYAFIEANGDIEGLDNLRACDEGMAQLKLNVSTSGLDEIFSSQGIHGTAIFYGLPLPQGCHSCVESETCSGGYLPHRYSRARGFDNPSVWCGDLLKIFAHVRERLGVSHAETRKRRDALRGSFTMN